VILFVVALASTMIGESFDKDHPCFEPRIALARARLAAFEDPSKTGDVRSVALDRLATISLASIEKDATTASCYGTLLDVVVELGDARTVTPVIGELRNQATSPASRSRVDEFARRADHALRERGLAGLRAGDETDSVADVVRDCKAAPSGGDCPRRIHRFVRTGSVEMGPLLLPLLLSRETRKIAETWDAWLRLHKTSPDRSERLRVRIEAGGDPTTGGWAMADLLPGDDPRKWDPKDVALAIEIARLQLHARHSPSIGSGSNVPWPAREVIRRLGRMGFERTRELIGPTTISFSLPAQNPLDDPNAFGFGWTEHFPDEGKLYIHEWKEEVKRTSHSDPEAFLFRRWREADAAAPAPDVVKVRALLPP
jgi:hypothetical protein